MKPDTHWSYVVSNKKYSQQFGRDRKKINMLDSIDSWFDKSDGQVDNWTQVLGFKHWFPPVPLHHYSPVRVFVSELSFDVKDVAP